MKISKNILLLLILLTTVFSFNSCIKDGYNTDKINPEVNLTPSLAIPLFHSRQTIEDIMKNLDANAELNIDPTQNNLLYIVYKEDIISKRADEVLNLLQQLEEKSIIAGIDIPSGQLAFPPSDTIGKIIILDTLTFDYSNNNQMLDSAFLDKMLVNFKLNNAFEHYTIVQIKIPEITVAGQEYSHTVLLNPSQTNYTETQNLENIIIKFNNTDYPGLSVLDVQYTFWAVKNPSAIDPNNLQSGNSLDINMTFDSIDFSKVYGYIGQHELLSQADSIPIRIFESDYEGIIQFWDPVLNFNINNSLGVPIDVKVSNVHSSSIKTNTESFIDFSGDSSKIVSLIGAQTIGDIENATFSVEKENSNNFRNAFNTNPNKISYNVDGNTNPDGNTGKQNVVMDSSKFDASMELILPMHCKTTFYGIRDTIPFVLDSLISNVDFLKTLQLQIETENGLPADVMEQLYFTDSNYVKLDSLFKDPTLIPNIPSAPIIQDDLGVKANGTTHNIAIGTITNPKEYFENVQYILLEAVVNTAKVSGSADWAKFYAENELYVKVGVNIEMDYTGTIDDITNIIP